MSDDKKKPDEATTGCLAAVSAMGRAARSADLLLIWRAYISTILWGWFVVPLGVQSVSLQSAAGILTLWHLCFRGRRRSDKTEVGEDIAFSLLTPLFALFGGWVILRLC